MARACEIHLTKEERNQLESWVRKTTTEQRIVQRARIVLESAGGESEQGDRSHAEVACGHGKQMAHPFLS